MSKLLQEISQNVEFFSTTDNDSIPSISIEELAGILVKEGIINELEGKALLASVAD